MPTYEYACTKCDHTFEAFQSMKDEPLKKCPKCQKNALKRLLGTGAGLIFKGSGFYITDYRKNGSGSSGSNGDAAKSTKAAESKSTGSGESAKSSSTASKSP